MGKKIGKIVCNECNKFIELNKDGLEITNPKGIDRFHYKCFEKMLKRLERLKRPQTEQYVAKHNKEQEKIVKIANEFAQDGAILPLKIAIENLLKAQRERLSKTFDKNIGTKFEIAENNFKAGQKEERENMIKVIEGIKSIKKLERDFKFLPNKRGIWYGGFGQAKREIIKALKDNE